MTTIKTKTGFISEPDFLAAANMYGVGHAGMSLWHYIERGRDPGGFLTAVLCNDLSKAVGRADDRNVELIPNFVKLLYNFAPADCWGSEDQMNDWLTTLRLKDREPRVWRVTVGKDTTTYWQGAIVVQAHDANEAADIVRHMDSYDGIEFTASTAQPVADYAIDAVDEVVA